mmetsp:Transcript_11171/g.41759  ORF Transcript_11171/g.41759 Transcript_11171/m.41759 type:complete len:191 (+) Transcript_11171:5882-6454(+)
MLVVLRIPPAHLIPLSAVPQQSQHLETKIPIRVILNSIEPPAELACLTHLWKILSKPTLKINVPDKDSYFPLHYACLNNKDAGIVRMLLAHEAKCFVQDDDGMTPLHRACENGASLEMVELLLEHDASAEFLNAQNVNGWSALHLASYNQIRSICELLLKKGANTDLRTKAGKAAVFWGLGITHNHAAPF